jgi:hypothetical protein
MKKLFTILTTLLLTTTLSVSAAIVNETWADGERATQDPSQNTLAWFSSAGSSTVVVDTGSMTQLTGGSSRHILAYFTASGSPVAVSIGQQIQLNFTISFPRETALGDTNDFRVGLFNSHASRVSADSHGGTNTDPENSNYQEAFMPYSGYIFSGGVDDSRSISLRQRTPNTTPSGALISSTNAYATLGSTASDHTTLSPNVEYSGSLTINRTGVDSAEISYLLTAGEVTYASITRADSSDISYQFDTVAFVLGSNIADGFTLTQVEVIPEPRHYALVFGGLALAFLLLRRRFH